MTWRAVFITLLMGTGSLGLWLLNDSPIGKRAWTAVLAYSEVEAPVAGAIAPDFRLPPLNPTTTSGRLSSYRPHVVLLTFWATWCGPCKKELPELQRLADHYGPDGFRVIAISIDQDGQAATFPFATLFNLQIPILHDPDSHVAHRYQVHAVPQSFLINRDGRIVWREAGAIDWDDTRKQELAALLHAER